MATAGFLVSRVGICRRGRPTRPACAVGGDTAFRRPNLLIAPASTAGKGESRISNRQSAARDQRRRTAGDRTANLAFTSAGTLLGIADDISGRGMRVGSLQPSSTRPAWRRRHMLTYELRRAGRCRGLGLRPGTGGRALVRGAGRRARADFAWRASTPVARKIAAIAGRRSRRDNLPSAKATNS